MSVARLAEAVGMDKGQISRALAGLVSRKLVSRTVNPRDNREVLVCLTRTGLIAHETIVAGGLARQHALPGKPSQGEEGEVLGGNHLAHPRDAQKLPVRQKIKYGKNHGPTCVAH